MAALPQDPALDSTLSLLWHGYCFVSRQCLVLDTDFFKTRLLFRQVICMKGAHHDTQAWQNPHAFYPERFAAYNTEDFGFIANGGGRYDLHHRCPGEWISQALLKVMVELLVNDLQYSVPAQDLSVSLQDIPTLPRSRMVIKPLRYQHPLAAG